MTIILKVSRNDSINNFYNCVDGIYYFYNEEVVSGMIVFELSMPNKGSWNGKWSQEGQLFVRTRREYWGGEEE